MLPVGTHTTPWTLKSPIAAKKSVCLTLHLCINLSRPKIPRQNHLLVSVWITEHALLTKERESMVSLASMVEGRVSFRSRFLHWSNVWRISEVTLSGPQNQGTVRRWGGMYIYTYVCANSLQPYLTLCNPTDCSPLGSSAMGFSRQEYWRGLPFPSPRVLPDPGIKLASPALAGGFFTTSATRVCMYIFIID